MEYYLTKERLEIVVTKTTATDSTTPGICTTRIPNLELQRTRKDLGKKKNIKYKIQ